jgi:hypothetical protein
MGWFLGCALRLAEGMASEIGGDDPLKFVLFSHQLASFLQSVSAQKPLETAGDADGWSR